MAYEGFFGNGYRVAAPMAKEDWMSKNGFNENGTTFIPYGKSTFEIKDFLKENGYKFSSELKWHGAFPIELPEGYEFAEVSFNDIYEWDGYDAYPKETLKQTIDNLTLDKNNPSVFMGEVGERLRNLKAVFKSCRTSMYGYIYTFMVDDNICIWMTQKELEIDSDTEIFLTGTVKNHNIYNGVKQTILTRCIVKEF